VTGRLVGAFAGGADRAGVGGMVCWRSWVAGALRRRREALEGG
jgi:hypothetical protein